MRTMLYILMGLSLTGCSFVIGKYPNPITPTTYCVPCIEIPGEMGGGLAIRPSLKPWYHKVSILWRYK